MGFFQPMQAAEMAWYPFGQSAAFIDPRNKRLIATH
jgi:hypothetical protein